MFLLIVFIVQTVKEFLILNFIQLNRTELFISNPEVQEKDANFCVQISREPISSISVVLQQCAFSMLIFKQSAFYIYILFLYFINCEVPFAGISTFSRCFFYLFPAR